MVPIFTGNDLLIPYLYRLARYGIGLGKTLHQSMPPEQADEHVRGDLEPLWILQSHHAVVIVKQSQTPLYRKFHPLVGDQLFLHRQCKPIPHHIFYNNIKECGKDETSLSCTPSSL